MPNYTEISRQDKPIGLDSQKEFKEQVGQINLSNQTLWGKIEELRKELRVNIAALETDISNLNTSVASAGSALSWTGHSIRSLFGATSPILYNASTGIYALTTPLAVGYGGTGAVSFTSHSLLMGTGATPLTALGVAGSGQLPIGSAGADPVLATLTGTANQVLIANGAGSIALSLPQDIHAGASPTFADLTLSAPVNIYALQHNSFAGYSANRHIDHTAVSINTTTPLSGGGDISASRTISLGGLAAFGAANTVLGMNAAANAYEYKAFAGTANQVTITHAPNLVTWALPQDIHTGASPQFVGMTLTGDLTMGTGHWMGLGAGGIRFYFDGPGNSIDCLAELDMNSFDIAHGGNIHSDAGKFYADTETANTLVYLDINKGITTMGAATNGQLAIGATGAAPVLAALTGTANRVTVASGAGTITLSGPQDIHTAATPTFTGLTLSGLTPNRVLFAGAGGLISDSADMTWASNVLLLNGKIDLNGNVHIRADNKALYLGAGTDAGIYFTGTYCTFKQWGGVGGWHFENGNVGIGIVPSATSKFRAFFSLTNTNNQTGGSYNTKNYATANGSYSSLSFYCQSEAFVNVGVTNAGTLKGGEINALARNVGALADAVGLKILYGKYDNVGNLTNATGIELQPTKNSGTTTTSYGLKINAPSGVGTLTSGWPIYSLWDAPSRIVGAFQIDSDSNGLVLGNGQNSSILHNGSDMVIDPALVGSGSLKVERPVKIKEIAAALADSAGYGQLWVKNDTPNKLYFTDDAGTDHEIAFV